MEINSTTLGLTVRLDDSVMSYLLSYRQLSPKDNEACGILIGTTSTDHSEISVCRATEPQQSDSRRRVSFFINGNAHQKILNQEFNESGGERVLVGTWHTHPENKPTPSKQDYIGWTKVLDYNKGRTFIFVIVGITHVRVFTRNGENFVKVGEYVI